MYQAGSMHSLTSSRNLLLNLESFASVFKISLYCVRDSSTKWTSVFSSIRRANFFPSAIEQVKEAWIRVATIYSPQRLAWRALSRLRKAMCLRRIGFILAAR